MRNNILSIHDDNGIRTEEESAVKNKIVGFYTKLLGTQFDKKKGYGEMMKSLITSKVSDEFKAELIKEVTTEEIKLAMFSIKGDKAPGPDGHNVFFHQNWDSVGSDVVSAIKHFFVTGFII